MVEFAHDPLRRLSQVSATYSTSEWQRTVVRTGLLGTLAFLSLLTATLTAVRVLVENPFATATLPCIALTTVAAWGVYVIEKKKKITNLAGVCLILLYGALGAAMAYRVGVGAAAAILFSVVVILASALYGFWLALIPTASITVGLLAFRTSELHGGIQPDYIFVPAPTNYDTVVALVVLLHVLLFACSAVRHYLAQASQRLQASEAEKFRQLYRFAEIGEIYTALIHDLASGLTLLGLEVDSVKRPSASDMRIKKKVKQLSNVLHTAQAQMVGHHPREKFDIAQEISRTIHSLRPVAQLTDVTLEWNAPLQPIPYACEKILFQQVLTILLKNAIDSFALSRKHLKRVQITLSETDGAILLTITDWGKPIMLSEQEHIFEPFYSTKKGGMGMGLYLSKRFIEDSLGGTIELHTTQKKKIFSINLPKNINKHERSRAL